MIAEAAHLAAQATQPIDDIRGTAAYRRRMAEVIVRRLLTRSHRSDRELRVTSSPGLTGWRNETRMKPEVITLNVNGRAHHVALAPNVTLLTALRDLGYTDVKCGCEKGDCGACAVCCSAGAERRGRQQLPRPGLAGRRRGHHDGGGAGHGRAAASAAGRLCRHGRDPVRLLHAGPDHRGQGAPGSQPASDRARDPRGD